MRLIILILLLPILSFAQITKIDNIYTYEKIVETEMSTDYIYSKAKAWIALNYVSANDVIQLDSNNKLISKGIFTTNYMGSGKFRHTLIIDIKDNKYRITIKNFSYVDGNSDLPLEGGLMFKKNAIKHLTWEVNDTSKSLIKYIESIEDDW